MSKNIAAAPSLTVEGTGKNAVLVFRIPANEAPTPSKSGKNLLVASTGGNMRTNATVDGKPVIVGFNAYIAA